MQRYKTLISAFFIMLCLGGVYAWSSFAFELQNHYKFTTFQSQLIFGMMIAVFPVTMLFVRRLKKISSKKLIQFSALLFAFSYIVSGLSKGNFYIIFFSLGILLGIATGIGYLLALTIPMKWFPHTTGLVSGVIAAGFGLASVILPYIIKVCLDMNLSVLNIFVLIGLVYGCIIFVCASYFYEPKQEAKNTEIKISEFILNKDFQRLFIGIFLGTFAGLLIIGNLKTIGAERIDNLYVLITGISIFSFSNFLGRITWGYFCDYKNNDIVTSTALVLQSISIFFLLKLQGNIYLYLILSGMIGFCFGANFVIFAKQTSQLFGINQIAYIYPCVFLGYALAGILGPTTGAVLNDLFKNFNLSIILAALMSLTGAMIFILKVKKDFSSRVFSSERT